MVGKGTTLIKSYAVGTMLGDWGVDWSEERGDVEFGLEGPRGCCLGDVGEENGVAGISSTNDEG